MRTMPDFRRQGGELVADQEESLQCGQLPDFRRQGGELIAPQVESLQCGQLADFRRQGGELVVPQVECSQCGQCPISGGRAVRPSPDRSSVVASL